MSVKSLASLLCNRTSDYLLLTLLLTIYLSFCGGSLTENVNIFRDENKTYPETTIPQGKLQGIHMVTHHNRTVFGFMGIPYGQPPVADLRFKAPKPANPWKGTLNANSVSEPCPQYSDRQTIIGNEDCLYINVYTPQLPASDNSTSLLPVMVFIVGGGFKTQIVSPDRYGPDHLLDKDVLLVTPNFRVGILGYLSTGDEVSPGNYGLKDIVCALEWIRDNIKYFGGDPNRVTLFGGSSGAMSVHLLTLTNATNGLFHRYITQSGSAISSDLGHPKAMHAKNAIRLGAHFGCPTKTSTLLVECLRELNMSQLIDATSIFAVWHGISNGIWVPSEELDIDGALFTDTPANLIAAGNIRDLPWINLISRDEGLSNTLQFYKDPDYFEEFLNDIDLVLPYQLGYWSKVDDVAAYTAALKSFYLNDLTADRSILLANVTQMVGDSLFVYPAYSALQKHMILATSPQYFTCFQYRGTFSFSYLYTTSTKYDGVVHADELIYLFGHQGERLGPPGDKFSEADWHMVDIMVQLWTSFATNGIPTMLDSMNDTIWEPYSALNNYLRIGNQSDTGLEMKYDLYIDRMQFWDELTKATASSAEIRIPLLVLMPIALCLCALSYIL